MSSKTLLLYSLYVALFWFFVWAGVELSTLYIKWAVAR